MKLISIAPRADAMNATTSPPIAIFALTPPQVLLKTDPVIGAHIGVSIVNHYKDPLGMAVLFGPWQGQDLYETVHLHLNNNPKPISSEIVFSISDPVLLRLPAGLLLEDINSLHCTVERLSGNGDTSPSLTVLYDAFAPGGDEQVPGGGHSALAINATPTSVDASQAAQGVLLTLDYPHKHLYDLITVDSGGVETKHRIEPTPTNPNPDLTQPITLTLTTPHFAKDPNNPQFPIKYNVISQTNNYSGTTQLGQFNAQDHWSIPCLIDVHLDWAELLEAILQEILGENGDDPKEVDLGKMNGGPLWALIHLINTIWQAGDECDLTFEALVNGVVTATHQVKVPVIQVPGQLSVDIPNAKVIPGSTVQVTFKQTRGGKIVGVSKTAEARVVGAGLPELEMDVSPVHLSAERYYADQFPPQFPEYFFPSDPKSASYIDRKATGGVGTIIYASSDTNIVSVNQDGRSYARGNGEAIVTATDAANQSKSYKITTSGTAHQVVFRFWTPGLSTWKDASQFAVASGGRLLTLSEVQSHSRSFTPTKYQDSAFGHGTWTSTPGTSGGQPAYWIGRWDGVHHLHADNPTFQSIYVFLITKT
ncbi:MULTISPECIES: hypothetical protein [unclassified Pseudomonas]|uniref:hypothetical protein n=1 Tax=unclassified Pseudomonas TaxID=196821 RepID=UPI00101F0E78|nr:hypothetical protein [Pseudomonas sp. B10]